MLARYKELLEQYHTAISAGDWHLKLKGLNEEMDPIWDRLGKKEREECIAHANALYQRRIARA